jgi:gluconate kinase
MPPFLQCTCRKSAGFLLLPLQNRRALERRKKRASHMYESGEMTSCMSTRMETERQEEKQIVVNNSYLPSLLIDIN